jgi:hypothetical protein
MRFKTWLWVCTLVFLMGSIPLLASDRDRYRGDNRDANYGEDNNSAEWTRGHGNGWMDEGREHEREWREYLKERNRAYKDYSRASRREREEFAVFLREYDRRDDDRHGNWERRNEPRNGACFYTDSNYRGRSFCLDGNERQSYVGDGFNDKISSIRVFGRTRVTVYEHENFHGARRVYSNDVSGLGKFNDKISSIEIR